MKKKKNPRFLNDQKKGKPDAHKNSSKRIIGIIAIAVVLAIGAGVWWFLDYTKDDGLIYPNVFVFGTDLGGMTPEDATATLRLKLTPKLDSLKQSKVFVEKFRQLTRA